MTFEVKYRNKQGATEFLRVDAASRSEVFAILKERGIPSAIQVTDVTGKAKPRKLAVSGAPMSGAFKGLLALVAVCVIGAVAYLIISQDAPKPTKPAEKKIEKKSIEVVAPEIVERVENPAPVSKTVSGKPRKIPYWEQPTTNGLTDVQIRKWNLYRNPPSYTNRVTTARAAYAIFPTHVENEIACLMTLQPGEGLVGSPVYSKNLEQEFLRSCEIPIIPTDEDTEYQRQLKLDMNQVKIELRQRMANGERLEDILRDTRQEAQRMAQMRQELERGVRALARESATSEADLDDCINAANSILESKGIAPIKMNPLTRHMLIRSIERKNINR